MANRRFSRQVLHLQPGTYSPVKVWLKVTTVDIDAGGVTINAGGEAVATVADGGVGIVTVTMKDTYKNLIGYNAHIVNNDGGWYEPELAAEDVDGAKTLTLHFRATTDDALTEADNLVFFVELTLEN